MRRRVILFLMNGQVKIICAVFALVLFIVPQIAFALQPDVLQSVVRIKPDWPLLARGVDASGAPRDPQGTGIAVFPGGYIATNVHVLGQAKNVEVLTEDGRQFAGKIVGRDHATDIALLKIDADLPVLATASDPKLAEPVCAIGNQFGLGLSVTCGVVSAIGRSGVGFNPVEDFIQTDASVNPGGSGGALIDRHDHLVGMVSAIFTKQSDADIGINFAVSVPLLMRVVEDLKTYGHVKRAIAGFKVNNAMEKHAGNRLGALVESVDVNGPAFVAGLRAGDTLASINGKPLKSLASLEAMMFMFRPDESITLQVWRGAEQHTVTLMLGGS